MALKITFDRDKKKATFTGVLGSDSSENATVASSSGTALTAGKVRLHRTDSGAAVAEWDVTAGTCTANTRTSGIAAIFASMPLGACVCFKLKVSDSDDNLLGVCDCTIINSYGDGSDIAASGGPLSAPAGEAITAGCPIKIYNGEAFPCPASDHVLYIGIATNCAEQGENVAIQRGGVVHLAEWGLTPRQAYWLPQSGQSLSDAPAGQALMVGIAQDADTFILTGGRLTVQPRPTGSDAHGWYIVWDPATRRLAEVQAISSGGLPSANMIPRLDAAGLIAASMIPQSAISAIASVLVAQHAALKDNPHEVTLAQVGGVSSEDVAAAVTLHASDENAHPEIIAQAEELVNALGADVAGQAATLAEVESTLAMKQIKPSATVIAALTALESLPVTFTENQLRQKFNELLAIVKGIYGL